MSERKQSQERRKENQRERAKRKWYGEEYQRAPRQPQPQRVNA